MESGRKLLFQNNHDARCGSNPLRHNLNDADTQNRIAGIRHFPTRTIHRNTQ